MTALAALPGARRTTTLLIAGAVASMVIGLVVDRAFFFVYSDPFRSRLGLVVQITTGATIPVVLFIVALLRVPATQLRRVIAIVLTLVAIPLLLLVLLMPMPRTLPLSSSIAPALFVAAWATVQRPRRPAWLLVAGPTAVVAVLAAGAVLLSVAGDVPPALQAVQGEVEGLVLGFAPIVAAIVCGALIARSSRSRVDGPTGQAASSTPAMSSTKR